jgi:hypothetical protein
MPENVTLAGWRSLLEARGHPLRETESGFTVWPGPDAIVTVAVEPDATFYPQYRQRFFLCEPDPEQVFRVLGCPEPHRTRWLGLVSRQPPGYWQDFLAGPGAWLLVRLARCRRVVAWSERGLPWDGLDCQTHRDWGLELPDRAATMFAATGGPEASRPLLLYTEDVRFADAVAACVLFASVGLRDCILADEGGAEAYLARHHDQVVVSVPDAGSRGRLFGEMQGAGWLFTDVSGYASSMDPDWEEEEDDGDTPEEFELP